MQVLPPCPREAGLGVLRGRGWQADSWLQHFPSSSEDKSSQETLLTRTGAAHWSPPFNAILFPFMQTDVGGEPIAHRIFWKLSRYWEDERKTCIDWDAHSLDFQGLKYEIEQSEQEF